MKHLSSIIAALLLASSGNTYADEARVIYDRFEGTRTYVSETAHVRDIRIWAGCPAEGDGDGCIIIMERHARSWLWLRDWPEQVFFLVDGERVIKSVGAHRSDMRPRGGWVIERIVMETTVNELRMFGQATKLEFKVDHRGLSGEEIRDSMRDFVSFMDAEMEGATLDEAEPNLAADSD